MPFETNKSLLSKVKAGDEVSWQEFYHAYRPLIWLRGGDMNLSDSEKEELVQMVMLEIFHKDILGQSYDLPDGQEILFKYDPARGRFRNFLKGIVTNQAFNIIRKRNNQGASIEGMDFKDENLMEKAWDEEWRGHLLNMSLVELRGRIETETYQAFELYALQGRSAEQTATFLDISLSSVYTAKSRCVALLKEIVNQLDER